MICYSNIFFLSSGNYGWKYLFAKTKLASRHKVVLFVVKSLNRWEGVREKNEGMRGNADGMSWGMGKQ